MGKDIKGRELGKELVQRADGMYMARFVDCYGKRRTLYNRDLKLLKRQLEKERYESEHGLLLNGGNMTLSEWFEEFLKLYKVDKVKDVTVHRIRQTFSSCKKRTIGMMRLQDIRAIHKQQLINELHDEGFSYGTLGLIKSLLNEMYKKAIGNGYVMINPLDSVVLPKKKNMSKDI